MDLPGFRKEYIKLTMNDHTLRVAAESPTDRPFSGKFEGQWRLGDEVNASAIAAPTLISIQ